MLILEVLRAQSFDSSVTELILSRAEGALWNGMGPMEIVSKAVVGLLGGPSFDKLSSNCRISMRLLESLSNHERLLLTHALREENLRSC